MQSFPGRTGRHQPGSSPQRPAAKGNGRLSGRMSARRLVARNAGMMIGKEEIMKAITRVLVFGALLGIGSAHALTVAYTTEGPMMRDARLAKFVGPKIGGPIAAFPDLEKGGTHRLSVRLNSKYFSEDKSFLYLVEFDVQQRVTDRDSGKVLFATLAKWYSWGIVPSESELHKNIALLITSKVNTWTPE